MTQSIRWFSELGMADLDQVGGKNASLGEMVSHLTRLGVQVPDGFATTSEVYREFLGATGLAERIDQRLTALDTDDTIALAEAGREIRELVIAQPFPPQLESDIRAAYEQLAAGSGAEASFAVRSSATAEDLPDASFAGQQETFLNVRGIDDVLLAIREVFASLYNDRAIAYRVHHDFEHAEVALSAGVQKMVRSDLGSSGVMFTVDTESGFDQAVFITSAYGLGEGVVQGAVNPDEFYVYKPGLREDRPAILKRQVGEKATKMVYAHGEGATTIGRTTRFIDVAPADRTRLSLTDQQVTDLARQALLIEEHYGRPMDIEWGLDGIDGSLYILQARPETVQSRAGNTVEKHLLTSRGQVRVEGRAIGAKIGAGPVRVLTEVDRMHEFVPGEVLVADMTDPDWEPIMKRASAIVTNRGGRTCHAAIIARELGIPAVVGTGTATEELRDGDEVTVSAAEGDTGYVYEGLLDFTVSSSEVDAMPPLPTKIMMNVGNPEQAFGFSRLPHAGVGLARLEFIINRQVGIHPRALLELDRLETDEPEIAAQVREKIAAYDSPRDYFIQRVAEGVATIAAAFAPEPVIVRMSDFKSNEYANLLAGTLFEPDEENPMIGYRGASRYLSEDFADCFALECEALRYVREEMGLSNV
ncbi:MAG: phosphoenolpyruvate synthase, partial [Brachybacterium sp.]